MLRSSRSRHAATHRNAETDYPTANDSRSFTSNLRITRRAYGL